MLVLVVGPEGPLREALAQQTRAHGHAVVEGTTPRDVPLDLAPEWLVCVPGEDPASWTARLGPTPVGPVPDDRAGRLLTLAATRVDLRSKRVFGADGQVQTLLDMEAALLAYLVARADEVVSREELLVEVWGYEPTMRTRTVDNTERRLRTRIEADPSKPEHVCTVRGDGYRFRPRADAPAVAIPPPTIDPPAPPSGTLRLGCTRDRGVLGLYAFGASMWTMVRPSVVDLPSPPAATGCRCHRSRPACVARARGRCRVGEPAAGSGRAAGRGTPHAAPDVRAAGRVAGAPARGCGAGARGAARARGCPRSAASGGHRPLPVRRRRRRSRWPRAGRPPRPLAPPSGGARARRRTPAGRDGAGRPGRGGRGRTGRRDAREGGVARGDRPACPRDRCAGLAVLAQDDPHRPLVVPRRSGGPRRGRPPSAAPRGGSTVAGVGGRAFQPTARFLPEDALGYDLSFEPSEPGPMPTLERPLTIGVHASQAAVGEALVAQLHLLGVPARVVPLGSSASAEQFSAPTIDGAVLVTQCRLWGVDPQPHLGALVRPFVQAGVLGQHALDLLDDLAGTIRRSARIQRVRALVAHLHDQVPVMPLLWARDARAPSLIGARVHGFDDPRTGQELPTDLPPWSHIHVDP